jgi:phosphomannomutase
MGLMNLVLGKLDPTEEALLDKAIWQTYANKDITPQSDFRGAEYPIMSDLIQVLGETVGAAKESGSDIGFAQDPDADRLVVVNEHGVVISEEMTLVLAIKNVLSKESGDIVINLSTSRMGEDLAESMGRKVYRTKIGEANVVQKLLEAGAPIGGEGSSGAIYPRINTARDSLVGISLVLELLARENKTVSELADSLPKYFMKKENFRVSMDLVSIYAKLKEKFKDAKINELDGIKFDFEDKSWIHIRPSNTEPLVRVFGEAKTQDRIDTLFREAKLTFE